MASTARGATLLGPDKLEIRVYPIPDIPHDGGLVKVERAGVCGTDVKYLHGKVQAPVFARLAEKYRRCFHPKP
jgi:threonine dehydrogenase-like Zn-dependent dehydrogenase